MHKIMNRLLKHFKYLLVTEFISLPILLIIKYSRCSSNDNSEFNDSTRLANFMLTLFFWKLFEIRYICS